MLKSTLWLATVVICELGITYRVPSPPRTVVLRRVMASTVPVSPATVTTSPTLNWSSTRIMVPFSMSFTRFCAASPIATPATPADASSGPMFTPTACRACNPTIAVMIASPVVRTTPASVRTCEMRTSLRRVPLRQADHPVGDDAQDPRQHQRHHRQNQQVRQLRPHKVLDVVRPLIQNLAHEPPLGKDPGSYRNQDETVHPRSPFSLSILVKREQTSPPLSFLRG